MENIFTKKEINEKIGKRIKQYRVIKNITQEKLSEMMDMSPTYIAMLEVGKTGVSVESLIKIANLLGITSDELLQDFIKQKDFDMSAKRIYNQFIEMDEKDKRLLLKISQHLIAEEKGEEY